MFLIVFICVFSNILIEEDTKRGKEKKGWSVRTWGVCVPIMMEK
jgi:hypothetical protein